MEENILARAALPAGANVSQLAGEVLPEDPPATVMGKVLHTVQDEMNNAYHMLSDSAVTWAVDLLRRAGQVICLGQGAVLHHLSKVQDHLGLSYAGCGAVYLVKRGCGALFLLFRGHPRGTGGGGDYSKPGG